MQITDNFNKLISILPNQLLGLLCIITVLISFNIQSGNLSIDTMRRLQVARSFWTDSPPALPDERLLDGVNDKKYTWYGLGHSLVLLPFDMAANLIVSNSPGLYDLDRNHDGMIVKAIISYTMSPLICVLSIIVCFKLLRLLFADERLAFLGALSFLCLTSYLQYVQNIQENSLLTLLVLSGYYFCYQWALTGSLMSLSLGFISLGFNLLIRLTAVFDLLAVSLFIAFVVLIKEGRCNLPRKMSKYIVTGALIISCFVFIDRYYQFVRFGSFTSTYMGVLGEQWKARHPELPNNFPFDTPFAEGFYGLTGSLEKSVFIFDPLIIFTAILLFSWWGKISPEVKCFCLSGFLLLLIYILFHAKYHWWDGSLCFGPRYLTSPAQLISLVAVPLFVKYYRELGRVKALGTGMILAYSLLLQVGSVLLPTYVEAVQLRHGVGVAFPPLQRWVNVTAILLDRVTDWGLDSNQTGRDFVFNFTPFIMRYHLPGSASLLVLSVWILVSVTTVLLTFLSTMSVLQRIGGERIIRLSAERAEDNLDSVTICMR